MHEYLKRLLNPEVEGMLDKTENSGESGEGGRSDEGATTPASEAARPTLFLDFTEQRLSDHAGEHSEDLSPFVSYDIPELGLVELHLEMRGPGIWYASLVDCEDGSVLAKGRLFPR